MPDQATDTIPQQMARPVTLGLDVAFIVRHTQDMHLLESLYRESERGGNRWMQLLDPTEVPLPFADFIVESLDSNPSSAAEFWRRVAQVRARMQEREKERQGQ